MKRRAKQMIVVQWCMKKRESLSLSVQGGGRSVAGVVGVAGEGVLNASAKVCMNVQDADLSGFDRR